MQAIIVKKIQTEIIELKNNAPYYREVAIQPMNISYLEEGKVPDNIMGVFNDIYYERMSLVNPEKTERKEYYVRVDDRKIWNDLVKVSDGFINSKIEKGIQEFRDNFLHYDLPKIQENSFENGINSVKEISWFKRLFNKF